MDHNDSPLMLHLADQSATEQLGREIAPTLSPGMKIYLRGELGAGKTCLVRALIHALGFNGRVKSPTYTLFEAYNISSLYLYHFDFYRFRERNEWTDSGFREYFATTAICLVEWPDRASGLLPAPELDISLEVRDHGRNATILPHGEMGLRCIATLQKSSLLRVG